MKNKDWKKVKLGEVVMTLESGKREKGGSIDSGVFSLGAEHLDSLGGFKLDKGKFVSESFYNQMQKGKISIDDILIVKDGATTGKVSYVNASFPLKKSAINEHVFKLVVNEAEALPKYVFYFLYSPIGQLEMMRDFRGATVGGITKQFVDNVQIPLPPISEQKAIAVQLDRADKLRQALAQSLADYDRLLAASFLDMFGDPVLNPKGWELVKLGEVAISENNKRVPIKSGDRNNRQGKYPYYGASGIIDSIDDYTHEGTRLLVGEDGANLLSRNTPIGFLASGQYWVNNHAHVLKNTDKTELAYLLYFINCIDLEVYVTGSAQPKLNKKNLDRIPIPLPPLPLQQQFAQLVERIERQKALIQSAQQSAEDLFGALLQAYFYEGK
ncbi:restriction endonuclease subunit S [Saprospira grandis]|uniref:Restriction modification system DNA specificity domain protein n=1 Tax=Saprospira grandis (strain Lewin) TaxID=984262 RepID=H6L5V1_SAPGL|nr:restriction endonuclease subunit S [Saprospira grandis]AFC26351.1 restriction modification system DNA specificity domain protein [Saprospira grandis str. Lewin]